MSANKISRLKIVAFYCQQTRNRGREQEQLASVVILLSCPSFLGAVKVSSNPSSA